MTTFRSSENCLPRCLSIRQPWAWLICHRWKNIENREWFTRVRGRVLIHAGKTMTRGDYEACRLFVEAFTSLDWDVVPPICDLDRGGIVGETTILDCVTSHTSEWFTGPFGFVVDDSRPLPFLPCRGRLNFFNLELAGSIPGLVSR